MRALCVENFTAQVGACEPDEPQRWCGNFAAEIKTWLKVEDCWVLEHVCRMFRQRDHKGADNTPLLADGVTRPVSFDAKIDRNSWVALRILPSSHTNPIFVLVGGQPIRASKQSAEWCLRAVDQCWLQKSPRMRPAERLEAEQLYEQARAADRKRLSETQ